MEKVVWIALWHAEGGTKKKHASTPKYPDQDALTHCKIPWRIDIVVPHAQLEHGGR